MVTISVSVKNVEKELKNASADIQFKPLLYPVYSTIIIKYIVVISILEAASLCAYQLYGSTICSLYNIITLVFGIETFK